MGQPTELEVYGNSLLLRCSAEFLERRYSLIGHQAKELQTPRSGHNLQGEKNESLDTGLDLLFVLV